VCVVLSRVHSIVRAAWKWQHTLLARRLPKAGQRYGPEGRRVPHRRPVRGNAPWPRPTSRAATHTLCSRSSIHRAACRCKSERAAYCRISIIFQREVFTTSMQCNRDVISNEVKRDGGLCGQVIGEEGLGQLERAREREGRSASIHASLGSGGNRYGRRMLVSGRGSPRGEGQAETRSGGAAPFLFPFNAKLGASSQAQKVRKSHSHAIQPIPHHT
jgi:hypothetical protein